MIIFQLVYSVWTIWFAFLNKKWIETDAGFRHWANSISHLSAATYAGIEFGWPYGIAILFLVRTLFDGCLSMFRRLSFDYVSPNPKSFVDRMEKKIFGKDGMTPKLIYLLIAVLLNIFANKLM